MLYTKTINKNKSFLYLYKKGKCIVSKNVVIYVRRNNKPYNMLGITAGKKVGNAVARNRAKRVIRQAYRENEINMPIGIDMIIVARSSACRRPCHNNHINSYRHVDFIFPVSLSYNSLRTISRNGVAHFFSGCNTEHIVGFIVASHINNNVFGHYAFSLFVKIEKTFIFIYCFSIKHKFYFFIPQGIIFLYLYIKLLYTINFKIAIKKK